LIAYPVVEADAPFGRLSFEIGRGRANRDCHGFASYLYGTASASIYAVRNNCETLRQKGQYGSTDGRRYKTDMLRVRLMPKQHVSAILPTALKLPLMRRTKAGAQHHL
jgi:hypothetical protein